MLRFPSHEIIYIFGTHDLLNVRKPMWEAKHTKCETSISFTCPFGAKHLLPLVIIFSHHMKFTLAFNFSLSMFISENNPFTLGTLESEKTFNYSNSL